MNSKYRCELINFKNLTERIFIGQNLYEKLINYHKFHNEYGSIELFIDDYSPYVDIKISSNSNKFSKEYLPFILLKDFLIKNNCKQINENEFRASSMEKLIKILNDELIYIPKSLIRLN